MGGVIWYKFKWLYDYRKIVKKVILLSKLIIVDSQNFKQSFTTTYLKEEKKAVIKSAVKK